MTKSFENTRHFFYYQKHYGMVACSTKLSVVFGRFKNGRYHLLTNMAAPMVG